MENIKLKEARTLLSGSSQEINIVKFFDNNKEDPEFIYFLQKIFEKIKDTDENAREFFVKNLGEDLGWPILDKYDSAYLKADKRLLEDVQWSENENEFKENMKKLLKKIENENKS